MKFFKTFKTVAALSLTLSLATSISPTFAADEGKKIVQPNLDENFWNDYNSWLANRIRIKGNDPGGSGMTLGVDSTLYYTTSGSFTKRTQYNGTAGGNYYTTTSSGGKLLGWGTTSGLGYAEVQTWVGPEFTPQGSGSKTAYISFYGRRYGAMLGSGTSQYKIVGAVKDLTTGAIIGEVELDSATLTGSQTVRNYEGSFPTKSVLAVLEGGHRYHAFIRLSASSDSNANMAANFGFDKTYYYNGSTPGVFLDKVFVDFK
ncbi:hypothetical protein [Brevibacillus agri]|uniref:hypothetical protein n=1 Tax=Brevibacillus agri TaxID=51101 RepID=UPI003D74D926